MTDQGALVGNPESAPNLPKQHLTRLAAIVFRIIANIMSYLGFDCSSIVKPYRRTYQEENVTNLPYKHTS